jgi:hypothetical protein
VRVRRVLAGSAAPSPSPAGAAVPLCGGYASLVARLAFARCRTAVRSRFCLFVCLCVGLFACLFVWLGAYAPICLFVSCPWSLQLELGAGVARVRVGCAPANPPLHSA